jgi:DNA-binding transcriptional LysR family regulator
MKQDLRNVSLRQLRVLAAVIRTGSVTAAAQRLNVSPPAITLQMQLLQDQAGLPLINRTAAGTAATDAGAEILRAIDQIEAVLEDCTQALAAIAGGRQGAVSVGVISTAKYFAPRVLGDFLRAQPGIELRVLIGNRSEIIGALQRNEIDIAVMGRPPDELDVEAAVIGAHPHVIIAASDHPLARETHAGLIPAARLADEAFVMREPGSGTRALAETFFAGAGLSPRIAMQISSNESIKQAVIAGLGIAFISGHTIDPGPLAAGLTILPVEGLPIIRQWYIVHLRQRRLMPAARSVRDFFIAEVHRYVPSIKE